MRCFVVYRVSRGISMRSRGGKKGGEIVFSRFLFSFFFFKSKFEDFHNAKCKIDRGDVIPCYFLLLLAAEIII